MKYRKVILPVLSPYMPITAVFRIIHGRRNILNMTKEQIAIAKKEIDGMSQLEMARLWRFAPAGHPYFDSRNGDLPDYFKNVFWAKGGMTPGISKQIGWKKE